MTKQLALVSAISTILFLSQIAVADPETARMKAGTCLGCHGVPSYTNVYPSYSVPKLAGQHSEYIASSLRAYRSGERSHPTMRAQAAGLSDQDIEMISKFFASQPSMANEKDFKPALIDNKNLATCAACHTDTGNSTIAANPRLAGQHRNYLLHALKSYKNGARKNPVMIAITSALSEDDMEELAAFYAHNVGLGVIDLPSTVYQGE